MEGQPSQGSGNETIDLAIAFRGLQITVRGPAGEAADFVRDLTTSEAAPSTPYRSSRAPSAYSPASPPRPTTRPIRESSSSQTRASVQESFGECPSVVLALAARLTHSSGRASPSERIKRAWTAGKWAAATAEGRVSSPNRTPTIDLPNRIYAVIRSPLISSPRIFTTSRDFFAAVGNLDGSETVSPQKLKPGHTLLGPEGTILPPSGEDGSHATSPFGDRAGGYPALCVGPFRGWCKFGRRSSGPGPFGYEASEPYSGPFVCPASEFNSCRPPGGRTNGGHGRSFGTFWDHLWW